MLRRRNVGLAGLLLTAALATAGPAASQEPAIPSLYGDPAPFLAAIATERQDPPARPFPVTGITAPHHLLAADLIARAFWAAAGQRYERVIVVSPDHFNRSARPLATTRRDFETVLGRLPADAPAVATLAAEQDLVETSDLFEKEHGVAALLPFVRHFFPQARIVPVAVSLRTGPAEWERAAALIARLAGPGTLLVQSTDYSHYLPPLAGMQRDQETLNVIAAGDVAAVAGLLASDHMDSRGAQHIQMRVQAGLGAAATVVGNRNSVEYGASATRTTSYVVSVYSPQVATFPFRYPDQDVLVLGGDAFPGRWLTRALADPGIAAEIVARVRALTGGAALVVNLEGAMLAEPPEGLGPHLHAMHAGLALPILKAMGVVAAGLANNHSHDLGRDGFRETIDVLKRGGVTPLVHGEAVDLGPIRMVALNFVGRNDRAGFPVVGPGDIEKLCRDPARPPLVALVHWGVEYETGIGPGERRAAADLARCGAAAIVGAHSHRASEAIEAPGGGAYALMPSLGNFLFDQTSPRGSGALVEIRRFRQGTIALRRLPMPNLFELGNALLRAEPDLTATSSP